MGNHDGFLQANLSSKSLDQPNVASSAAEFATAACRVTKFVVVVNPMLQVSFANFDSCTTSEGHVATHFILICMYLQSLSL